MQVASIYWWKGVWQEVYGIPFMMPGAVDGQSTQAGTAYLDCCDLETQTGITAHAEPDRRVVHAGSKMQHKTWPKIYY